MTPSRATVLAQLSDAHLSMGPGDRASARALEAAVASVAAMDPAPHAVLVSGDLAETGSPEEYRRAKELLAPLRMPIHVVAGNHDDRDELRAHFAVPEGGDAGQVLQYAVEVGQIRLLVCDTALPGRNEGSFGADRMAWLEAALAADGRTTTVLAMHHPPLRTGIRVVDEAGLAEADQRALGDLAARRPQVRRIVAGHVHRTMAGSLAGCLVFVCPSSYLQLHLASSLADRVALVREPAGFGVHLASGQLLTSHVLPVGRYGLVDEDQG